MERWFCANCERQVELDDHGRCGDCHSEAVDTMERPTPTAELRELATVEVGA